MQNWRSNGMLLLASFLWGSSNVSLQNVAHALPPITAVGLKCLLGSSVVLPFIWGKRSEAVMLIRADISLIALTCCFFAIALTLSQIGIGLTSVINASFFLNVWTILTPFCVWVLQGVRPNKYILPGAAITFAGTCLMSGGSVNAFNSGDILCLIAALVYSVWAIKLGEFVFKRGNALLISFIQFSVAGVVCTFSGLAVEHVNFVSLVAATPDLIIIGVFSTGIGFVLQAVAQTKTSASVAVVILSLEAVFGALGGALFLGENFTTLSLMGASLIFCGVILVQMTCNAELPEKLKAI